MPRTAYVGDVPVESTRSGSVLLHRLLQSIPPDQLRVVEANLCSSSPSRRLANVIYNQLYLGPARPLRTRFHAAVTTLYCRRAIGRVSGLETLLAEFKPQVIVTIAEGFSWLTAAAFATKHRLPLHLIVHDDWPNVTRVLGAWKSWLNDLFADVYRGAASRLCVSPYMLEEYQHRYGVEGTLLYPARSADATIYGTPPERIAETGRPLVYGFAGTAHTAGHVRALSRLADVLAKLGNVLHLYGPLEEDQAKRTGLDRENIRVCGFVPVDDLIARLRRECDVLFVPMSFAPEDQWNMRLCFPSKLTDYTAVGLPLLIYGPSDSSAVRWVREHPEVAEVAESEQELEQATARLSVDPQRRMRMAQTAIDIGRMRFSYETAAQIFSTAIRGDARYSATRGAQQIADPGHVVRQTVKPQPTPTDVDRYTSIAVVPLVTVIVPTIGRPDSLRRLLRSLARQTETRLEVIVADGSSVAETAALIDDREWRQAGLQIERIAVTPPNAVRQRMAAIAKAQGKFLLLLDDDVELEPDCVGAMVALMESAPDVVGVVANYNNQAWPQPTRMWQLYLRVVHGMARGDWNGRVVGPLLRFGYNPVPSAPAPMDWIGGGNTMIRSAAFADVGGFSDFFLRRCTTAEDVDLGIKIARKGRILLCPAARLGHFHAPGGRVSPTAAIEDDLYNRYWILRRTMGRGALRAFGSVSLYFAIETTSNLLGCIRRRRLAGLVPAVVGRSRALALILVQGICRAET